jgi:hypothetical protein
MLIADPAILNERPLKIRDLILFEWAAEEFMFPIEIQQGAVPKPSVNTWGAPKGDVWYPARAVGTETAPYVGTCVAVDPASGLATRDAIGVAVLSITASGQGVIRHLEGVRGPDKMQNIQRVAKIVQHYGATRLVVEELADGLFGETLEGALVTLQYPMMVEKVTTGGQQKGRRIIESLAPPMAAGRLVMLEQVARSDHGGDFVNQLVRISYDGRTGKAKDHDDIVDALAHAVKAEKSSLISSIADNIGEHYAAKIDRWRGVSLRYGGLGGGPEDGKTQRFESADVEGRFGESLTMAERLHEEDQVLVHGPDRPADGPGVGTPAHQGCHPAGQDDPRTEGTPGTMSTLQEKAAARSDRIQGIVRRADRQIEGPRHSAPGREVADLHGWDLVKGLRIVRRRTDETTEPQIDKERGHSHRPRHVERTQPAGRGVAPGPVEGHRRAPR